MSTRKEEQVRSVRDAMLVAILDQAFKGEL